MSENNLFETTVKLIRDTSSELPDDVQKVVLEALEREEKNTTAEYAMKIIQANIELAKKKSQPLCQDTGTILFFVSHPPGFHQRAFVQTVESAIRVATEKGFLRQNSVDTLTGKNEGMNVGPGHPTSTFTNMKKTEVEKSKCASCSKEGVAKTSERNTPSPTLPSKREET